MHCTDLVARPLFCLSHEVESGIVLTTAMWKKKFKEIGGFLWVWSALPLNIRSGGGGGSVYVWGLFICPVSDPAE